MSDMIHHPNHYNKGGLECFAVIDVMVEGYTPQEAALVSNITKYLYRAPYKGTKEQDIDKALEYVKRLKEKQVENIPPLSELASKSLNAVLAKQLEQVAKENGISVKDAINRAILYYVDQEHMIYD